MADPVILRANERYKAISQLTSQSGAALAGWGAVKMYSDGSWSLWPCAWLIGGIVINYVAWLFLGLLESED